MEISEEAHGMCCIGPNGRCCRCAAASRAGCRWEGEKIRSDEGNKSLASAKTALSLVESVFGRFVIACFHV
jgi:hypothetical protein